MKKLKIILLSAMLMPGFTVLAQEKTITDAYPNPLGHLRFNSKQLSFQNINNTETKTDTLKIYNEWDKPMTLAFTKQSEFLNCKAVPEIIKPKQKGYILITYDASKRNDFGNLNDRLIVETNDSIQPDKTIFISANVTEDFTKMTPEQLKNAPKIEFEKSTYDFGTINQGDKVDYDFVFSNTGKSLLTIRKTKGSCGCTVGTPEKSNLKPGESSKLHVTFNSTGKSGQQNKTITITCNDPTNPSAMISITGKVEVKPTPIPQPQTPKQ